jgi:hypothetical protein
MKDTRVQVWVLPPGQTTPAPHEIYASLGNALRRWRRRRREDAHVPSIAQCFGRLFICDPNRRAPAVVEASVPVNRRRRR